MKHLIKKLLREGLLNESGDNFGYRAGDITSRKPEKRSNFLMGGRHTGHFGTGYYFFSTIEQAEKYAKEESRVITKIPLDGYNLAKGTIELHEILKDINEYGIFIKNTQEDDEKLKYSLDHLLKYSGLTKKSKHCDEYHNFKYKYPIRNNKDYDNATDDYRRNSEREIEYYNFLGQKCGDSIINNEVINKLINILDSGKTSNDSPSTLVMKALGYDGVDSRYTELDNGVYGSVLYDVEKVERESIRVFIDKKGEEIAKEADDEYLKRYIQKVEEYYLNHQNYSPEEIAKEKEDLYNIHKNYLWNNPSEFEQWIKKHTNVYNRYF